MWVLFSGLLNDLARAIGGRKKGYTDLCRAAVWNPARGSPFALETAHRCANQQVFPDLHLFRLYRMHFFLQSPLGFRQVDPLAMGHMLHQVNIILPNLDHGPQKQR